MGRRRADIDGHGHQREVFAMLPGLRMVVVRLTRRGSRGPALRGINNQGLLDRLPSGIVGIQDREHGLLRAEDPVRGRGSIGTLPGRDADDQVGSVIDLPQGIGVFPQHMVP